MKDSPSTQAPSPPSNRNRLAAVWSGHRWVDFAIPLAIYASLAIPIAIRQKEKVHADLVCYIRRGLYLLQGDFYHVVSDYWSPLISWCIAPLLHLGIDGLYAARAVFCAWGAVLVIAVGLFLERFGVFSRAWRLAILCVVALGAVHVTSDHITPDAILSSLLFAYFAIVIHPHLIHHRKVQLAAGLMGGIAYLGKAYAFPFVLVHMPLTFAIRGWMLWRYGDDLQPPQPFLTAARRSFAGLGIALLGFIITAGPWMTAVSWRYGHLTFSSAGRGAHAIMGPQSMARRVYPPFHVAEDPYLIDWETPAIIHKGSWSPFDSWRLFRHQLAVARNNAIKIHNTLAAYNPPYLNLALAGILLAPLAALGLIQRPGQCWKTLWLLMTIAIYCSGFFLVFFSPRYIEGVTLPLTLLLCLILVSQARWPMGQRSIFLRTGLAILVLASFAAQGIHRARKDLAERPFTRIYRNVAEEIQRLGLDGPIASNDRIRGYYIALHTGQKSIGFPPGEDLQQVQQKLRSANAAVLVIWQGRSLRNEHETTARHAPAIAEQFWFHAKDVGRASIYTPAPLHQSTTAKRPRRRR